MENNCDNRQGRCPHCGMPQEPNICDGSLKFGRNFPEIKEYLIRSIILTILIFPIGALPLVFSILTIMAKNNGNYADAKSYSHIAYVSSAVLIVLIFGVFLLILAALIIIPVVALLAG